MTRPEVISYLKDNYRFNLSTSQFAKATKHWGFYKQPRQARTLARALEATALADPESSGAIFDLEVDALHAANENESLFHIDNTLSPDFDRPKSAKDDEDSCKEPSLKTEDTLSKAEKSHQRTRVSSNGCHTANVKSPMRITNAPKAQIPSTLRFSHPRVLDRNAKRSLVCDTTRELYLDYSWQDYRR
ncbi:hypothetical protein J7337_013108 [Fusarium musae]|uniref:Clr5 domain-containing protein n=1 Tax=Fusarium musae TaxID=1042133 RepID=A0A9P8D3Z0_9HYPO|nr:hypothetical protein J7337_013108 [Fusarium musae]KAG9494879.1 hypothetical protein J7337_013108 [Fusarium musae]